MPPPPFPGKRHWLFDACFGLGDWLVSASVPDKASVGFKYKLSHLPALLPERVRDNYLASDAKLLLPGTYRAPYRASGLRLLRISLRTPPRGEGYGVQCCAVGRGKFATANQPCFLIANRSVGANASFNGEETT